MIGLLDVNVLVALAWPNHTHHDISLDWFQRNRSRGWATCPVTQAGFVRVSSNRRVVPEATTPQEALAVLRRITALPDHVFWVDDVAFADTSLIETSKLQGHRQITDAHLLALALHNRGRLVTLDGAIRQLVPEPFSREEAVCVIA